MRVFVTGATGFIGSAVVQELLGAGHQVLGLVRSDASAAALAATGAQVHRGDVQDLESLRSGAAMADAVIHTAFIHDFTRFAESCEIDRRAIDALAAPLVGTHKPLVVTSGTALVAQARTAVETDAPPAATRNPRVASEQAAQAAAGKGVRVSVVRLPPSVHGAGDHGFVPLLIGIAREKGVSAYGGEGLNQWPAVHRHDAAKLFRLAMEKGAERAGSVFYHGPAEEGVRFREIAEAIGRGLGVPVVGKTPEEAAAHFGWFAHFAALDNPTSSENTRATLGWHPQGATLLADMAQAGYFA